MNEFFLKIQQYNYQLLYLAAFFFSYSLAYLCRIIIVMFLYVNPANNVPPSRNFTKTESSKTLAQYESIFQGNFVRGNTAQQAANRSVVATGGENMVVTGILSGHWSFARVTIQEQGENEATEYAIGNTIHGYKIKSIFPHYVIFRVNGQNIKVGIGESPGQLASQESGPISSGPAIKKVLSRSDIDAKLKDPTALYKGARFGPDIVEGKITGYKIFHVPDDHMFYALGARNGDSVRRVNGMPLTDTEKMLEIWNSVKTAENITIDIERQGKIITYEFIVRN